MCHRFANFETFDQEIAEYEVQSILSEYLKVLTQSEGNTAIAYHKCHSEVKDGVGNQGMNSERERYWTLCIVFNPKRCQKLD